MLGEQISSQTFKTRIGNENTENPFVRGPYDAWIESGS
jgi:hypothetical protein